MGNTDAPTAGHLFLDMPSSVALGIVEMQMPFATDDVLPLPGRLGRVGVITLSRKYLTVNDAPCGNKFTPARSFGLKKAVSIGFVVLII
jgi:hypothetical protein